MGPKFKILTGPGPDQYFELPCTAMYTKQKKDEVPLGGVGWVQGGRGRVKGGGIDRGRGLGYMYILVYTPNYKYGSRMSSVTQSNYVLPLCGCTSLGAQRAGLEVSLCDPTIFQYIPECLQLQYPDLRLVKNTFSAHFHKYVHFIS
jgi:hypothetical protein